MGTRADFYTGRQHQMRWLGSIAWDGHPDGLSNLVSATSMPEYLKAVNQLKTRKDWTEPEMGWPWPWEDSRTTDYAYTFDQGRVWRSCFGHVWIEASSAEDDPDEQLTENDFPNMSGIKRPAAGTPRDSIMVFTVKKDR